MGDIIKLAVRLFIFSLVAAVGLAMTNEVTKGPIAEQKIAAQKEALNKVLPGCEYEEIVEIEGLEEDSHIDQMFVGRDEETGEIVGYAFVADPQGYGGPIPLTIGVSDDGYVTQTYVGALQETAGLGSRVGEEEFQDQFIAIAADADTLDEVVDTIGGATVSSTAFIDAVTDILTYTEEVLNIEPNEGDKEAVLAAAAAAAGEPAEPVITANTYDVTGFGPIKIEVAVDDTGKIASVTVLEHNETPGFGADLIADTAVFEALVGQDIAGAQIDMKAGVTLTSKAINSALKQAGPQVPSDPYTVKGFDKFTINIAAQDGVIASVSVETHNETPGFGADILTEEVLDELIGQNLAEAEFDAKAGVTLTSTAINNALDQAAEAHGIEIEKPAEEAPVEEAPAAEEAAASEVPVYDVMGFQPFKLAIEVDENGKIVSVEALNHNETPGFGADILTADVLGALVGQDVATAQFDGKAGATLTTKAVQGALAEAAAAAPAAEASSEAAVNTYNVTGFQPFSIEIGVGADGKIASVNVPSHNETPGFGADILTADILGALVGQDVATAQFDGKAGATLTTKAVQGALAEAAAAAPAAEASSEAVVNTYNVTGFQPFSIEIGVGADGKIASVNVPSHNETPGFGADILTADVLGALVGQDVATAQFDGKAGATLTTKAVQGALAEAAASAPATEASSEAVVNTYNVTGFQPFSIEIGVGADGKIASVNVPSHNETPGFGADILTADILGALVGQDVATAQFDGKAGATLTTKAVQGALAEAAASAVPAASGAVTKSVSVTGFQPFTVEVVVEGGKVVSVSVPSHNETPGFGADLIASDAFEKLVGQDIATAQIDVKAGATLTSNAINNALAQVAKEVQ